MLGDDAFNLVGKLFASFGDGELISKSRPFGAAVESLLDTQSRFSVEHVGARL